MADTGHHDAPAAPRPAGAAADVTEAHATTTVATPTTTSATNSTGTSTQSPPPAYENPAARAAPRMAVQDDVTSLCEGSAWAVKVGRVPNSATKQTAPTAHLEGLPSHSLPASDADATADIPEVEKSAERVRVEAQLFTFSIIFLFFSGLLLTAATVENHRTTPAFWWSQAAKFALMVVTFWFFGELVVRYDAKVAYTRKVVHLFIFLWPQFTDKVIIGFASKGVYTELWTTWVTLFLVLLMSETVRRHCHVFEAMFRSLDRPEDRPNTLVWFTTQLIATIMSLFPFTLLFAQIGRPNWVFIPILVNGIGDGLAEPVGLHWGHHKFKARAMCSTKTYTRSLEGSACVYLVSVLSVALLFADFDHLEFALNIIFTPLVMTLAEAFSPHTWDGPFLTIAGCASLVVVYYIDSAAQAS